MFALPHVNQRTNDIAHHVMQKGACAEFEHNDIAVLRDLQPGQVTHGRPGLAFSGTERTEVMLPKQESGCGPHGSNIERLMKPAYLALVEPRTYRMGEQQIQVAALNGTVTRMKI